MIELITPVLILPFASQGNLIKVLKRNGITWKQKLSLLKDIAHGIQHLHRNNIVHGDIKCENILVDENNWGIICDLKARPLSRRGKPLGQSTIEYMVRKYH